MSIERKRQVEEKLEGTDPADLVCFTSSTPFLLNFFVMIDDPVMFDKDTDVDSGDDVYDAHDRNTLPRAQTLLSPARAPPLTPFPSLPLAHRV